jgi:dihydrofolate synthase/folylpolyglutamate synthase
MQYPEAIEYLNSFVNYEKERHFQYPEDLKLDRMKRLAKELGNPQNAYETVLIAGSKGKGSTAAILSSILRMENLKVGLYTSPHLTDLRERIQVNGLNISEVRFAEWVRAAREILEEHSWRKDPPTYFEILTAVAFCHFKELKAHVAVLEVGLGGLYDSTNIAPAKVVGITPISLEHTDKLGKTISKIAVQKCGIIKGREIVVSSPQVREAELVIQDAVREREAKLISVGKDLKIFERECTEDHQRFDLKGIFGNHYDLELRLRGFHQIENAACAFGLAKALEKKTRLEISESAVRRGILDARWPGRLEKVSERIKIVLDGAHNVDSVKKMILGLKRHFKYSDLIVILGVSQDKDLDGILKEILPEAACLIATQSVNSRALPAWNIAEKTEGWEKEVFVEEDFKKAVQRAKFLADTEDLILVTGSLFLVGDVRAVVGHKF